MMEVIEKGNYTGYLWMSDSDVPRIFENEEFSMALDPSVNPFVIEAQLYEESIRRSISVKFIDGKYYVNRVNIDEMAGVVFDDKLYVGMRMNGKILKFKQYWRPEKDGGCLDMNVLKAAETVFVGFKNQECYDEVPV